jgi:hypothetical protein
MSFGEMFSLSVSIFALVVSIVVGVAIYIRNGGHLPNPFKWLKNLWERWTTEECGDCKGLGQVQVTTKFAKATIASFVECDRCRGSGRIKKTKIPEGGKKDE